MSSTGSLSSNAGPINVNEMVNSLIEAERKNRGTSLTDRAKALNALISNYGKLKSSVASFESALEKLAQQQFRTLNAKIRNGASGNGTTEDPFTASIKDDKSTRSLSHKLRSQTFTRDVLFRQGDSIAIKTGDGKPTFITLERDTTLAGLRDLINKSGAGVSASIVAGAGGDRLELESHTGGAGGAIRIMANNSLSAMAYGSTASGGGMTQVQAPRDAAKAAAGRYSVEVQQLAQAHKVGSAAIPPGKSFDQGILAIKTGTGSTTMIPLENRTLAGIRDAINKSDAGVTATIISSKEGEHLVIASKETGAASGMTITGTDDLAVFSTSPEGTLTLPELSAETAFDNGKLQLQVGGRMVDIVPTDTGGDGKIGLNDVMAAINGANAGVTASIAPGSKGERLVLTPSGNSPMALTGTDSYARLSGSITGQHLRPQDARVMIDGVMVSSAGNTVKDAISGIELELNRPTSANDRFTVDVTSDASGFTKAANELMSAYNSLVKEVSKMVETRVPKPRSEKIQQGPLARESAVKEFLGQLRKAMNATGNGTVSLSTIGFSFEKGGTLKLDAGKLAKAIDKNPDGIATLFTAKDGIMERLTSLAKSMLKDDGTIAETIKGAQNRLHETEARQTALNQRLKKLRDSYTRQFNQLNQTLAGMDQTRNYLLQQFQKSKS